jgi:hypothetical protein
LNITGYTRMRLTCDYYNNTDATVYYGNGAGEMCIFLAFTDSDYVWTGGAITDDPPGPATVDGGVMTYTHPCAPIAI